jgi:hypothetical protein
VKGDLPTPAAGCRGDRLAGDLGKTTSICVD